MTLLQDLHWIEIFVALAFMPEADTMIPAIVTRRDTWSDLRSRMFVGFALEVTKICISSTFWWISEFGFTSSAASSRAASSKILKCSVGSFLRPSANTSLYPAKSSILTSKKNWCAKQFLIKVSLWVSYIKISFRIWVFLKLINDLPIFERKVFFSVCSQKLFVLHF